jgi:hypothetical protein
MSSPVTPTRTQPDGTNVRTVGTATPDVARTAPAETISDTTVSPLLAPPGTPGAQTLLPAGAATGTWHAGATVDALFIVDEVRNAWARIVNIGWKKIFNGSDGSFTALITLASQARQTGKTITYREEADGMIHEIYLW